MQEYNIYYRGECINVVRATSEVRALAAHYKQFAKGTKGKEVALRTEAMESLHKYAIEASKTPATN